MKQSIRTLLMLVAISISCSVVYAATPLRNGDLRFQESCRGTMNDAIKGVTTSISGYQFTHVGIVWIHQKDTFVIEATRPRVAITPLKEFLLPEAEKACPPVSVLARMKPRFQSLIPQAIEEARRLVGKDYDSAFILNNDMYYCSELIYEIFLKANQNVPVFTLNAMTFKAPGSKDFTPEWVEHYKKLGQPIPEGEPGINPGAMSKADVIEILGEL